MSAENGKLHAPTTPLPQMLPTTMFKRGIGSMLLANGNGAFTKLSSLTPPRDLTLGGRGPLNAVSKKVFTPNLNVVRNKNTNVKTSKDTTHRGRGRGKFERGRGFNSRRGCRGGTNSSLIQTTGVFSEGAGEANTKKSKDGNRSYRRSAEDTPAAMHKPMIVKREHQKLDVKAEASHVRHLLGTSDEDDFDDEKADLEKIPIKLNEAKWKNVSFEKPEIKLEKTEPSDENADPTVSADQNIRLLHQIHQMYTKQNALGCISCYPPSIEDMLDSKQQKIFLMQLPDTLPCEIDGTGSSEKSSPSEAKENLVDSTLTTPANDTRSNSLKNMEEGQIGKLLRYKSGKIKLVLGESLFDLNMGMDTGFLQDLMFINTNREERSGNMVNLGTIQAKLTATPDWEFMVKQRP